VLLATVALLVVVLDDLHWIDAASNEVLVSLVRRMPAAPILLALGYRSGRAPAKLVAALAAGSASLLELASLNEPDSARLAGEALEPGQRAAILNESGGNPFYILELARAARVPARSALDHRVADQAGVPLVVAATLLDEMHSVSAASRVVLECASIAGDPFEPELAFAIAAVETSAGIAALDELLDAGLVRATAVPRRFAFRHPLVRRAVYESTKAGWRLRAHSTAADALGRLGAPATARANHVEQSAAVGDLAGIGLLLDAGQASAAGNPEGAIRWFDAALRLIPAAERQVRLDTLAHKAEALRSLGRVEECRATLLAAIEQVDHQDIARRVGLTALAAFCENLLGRHEQARRRLEIALAELSDPRSADAVAVMNYLASGAFFTMELDRMRDTAATALAAARALGDSGLAGSAAAQFTHAHTLSGRIAEAETALALTRELLDGLSDAELAAHLEAVNTLGWTELFLERFDDSATHLERGLEVARSSGQGAFIPFMECALALTATTKGDHVLGTRMCENGRYARDPRVGILILFHHVEVGVATHLLVESPERSGTS
jgi:tetratricopeptide (TPR) repeat protein